MEGPVGVPKTEYSVVVAFFRVHLMNPQVGPSVTAVDIAREVGDRCGMVQ